MKYNYISNCDMLDESLWEGEYISEFLLKDFELNKITFDDSPDMSIPSIVFYSGMNEDVPKYVLDYIFKYGIYPYAFHFSNEWGYSHLQKCIEIIKSGQMGYGNYRHMKHVFRQYWQPLASYKHVTTVPLGWKTGFLKANKKEYNPEYDACFIGSLKNDRHDMADVMSRMNSYVHITSGWNKDQLSVQDQVDIYLSSVVCPCPSGGSHPDSFRICEVLEAGGIPVICSYCGFDYHVNVFGRSPIPFLYNWSELPLLVKEIKKFGPHRLANTISEWYNEYKFALRNKVKSIISEEG